MRSRSSLGVEPVPAPLLYETTNRGVSSPVGTDPLGGLPRPATQRGGGGCTHPQRPRGSRPESGSDPGKAGGARPSSWQRAPVILAPGVPGHVESAGGRRRRTRAPEAGGLRLAGVDVRVERRLYTTAARGPAMLYRHGSRRLGRIGKAPDSPGYNRMLAPCFRHS